MPAYLVSVKLREHDIEQYEISIKRLLQRLLTICSRQHLIAVAL